MDVALTFLLAFVALILFVVGLILFAGLGLLAFLKKLIDILTGNKKAK